MIEYNKNQLSLAAKQHGFVRDTFEKVLRLKYREATGLL